MGICRVFVCLVLERYQKDFLCSAQRGWSDFLTVLFSMIMGLGLTVSYHQQVKGRPQIKDRPLHLFPPGTFPESHNSAVIPLS